MSKFEEFKEFCKGKVFLIEKVKENETSWQALFEIYDIFGPQADEFKEPENVKQVEEAIEEDTGDKKSVKKEEKKEGLAGIFDLLGGFDADKLSEGLTGVKKIISVLSEVTKPEENEYVTKRKMTRPYQRSDD